MSRSPDTDADLRCSFCHTSRPEVRKMVAGHGGVAICDECVETCHDIVGDTPAGTSTDRWEPMVESNLFPFRCPACGDQWRIAGR